MTTVAVRCRLCGCPLVEIDEVGTVTWWVRNDALISVKRQLRWDSTELTPAERRQEREPRSATLDGLTGAVNPWCDSHDAIRRVSVAGLRARHLEALRTGHTVIWRLSP